LQQVSRHSTNRLVGARERVLYCKKTKKVKKREERARYTFSH
jgi:hypothetical protein